MPEPFSDLSAHIYALEKDPKRPLLKLENLARELKRLAEPDEELSDARKRQHDALKPLLTQQGDAVHKLSWCVQEMTTGETGFDAQQLGTHQARAQFERRPEYLADWPKDPQHDAESVGEKLVRASAIVSSALKTLDDHHDFLDHALYFHKANHDFGALQSLADDLTARSTAAQAKLAPGRAIE